MRDHGGPVYSISCKKPGGQACRRGFSVGEYGIWAGNEFDAIALRSVTGSARRNSSGWNGTRSARPQDHTDYLAAALRTAIYDGQFADSEELNQVELADFFGVSRVPIREALRQLQAEGLVQNIAHHRTIVTGLTLAQIMELIEMRAVLEAIHAAQGRAKLDKST